MTGLPYLQVLEDEQQLPELPELPDGWTWEATVAPDWVRVSVVSDGVPIGSRKGECPSDRRKDRIYRLARVLWDDLNEAAKLSADLGIVVLYE